MDENNKNLPFEVPKGYFDNLAGKIMQGVQASAENQSDTSSEWIDSISKTPVFEVPQGYFEGFAAQVLHQINTENDSENAIVTMAGKDMNFEVPALYFEQFADKLMHRINISDEDLVDTSALEALRNVNVFTVPNGYFETIQAIAPKEIAIEVVEKEVKTMSLPKRAPKWTNWAVAASVLFILGMGGVWMIGGNGGASDAFTPAQLASLTLENVSDEDIEQYIENDQESFDIYSLMDNASVSTKDKTQKSIDKTTDKLLDNISQEEIDAYLEYEGI